MRARIVVLSLSVFLGAATSSAQNVTPAAPAILQIDFSTVNCSGFVTDQKVPDEIRLVSGEQSNYKITFARGDYVHINRGQDKGVRVGDRFSVVRPDKDPTDVPWFKWQEKLLKAMGTYQDRPAPPYKDPAAFDHFAPVSGKPVAMVVAGKDYGQIYGKLSAVYVNLGTNQGVKVGDYLRIFRYQGSMAETVPQTKGYQYFMYGFGSAPMRYEWNDLPREILGEGIVINVNRNSSTMIITFNSIEVYAGDYIEIE